MFILLQPFHNDNHNVFNHNKEKRPIFSQHTNPVEPIICSFLRLLVHLSVFNTGVYMWFIAVLHN